jgi:carbonic anhydrase
VRSIRVPVLYTSANSTCGSSPSVAEKRTFGTLSVRTVDGLRNAHLHRRRAEAADPRGRGRQAAFPMESFSDLEDDVRQSIARIQYSPFIPHKDSVRGFVYEVETGRLREIT